MVPLRDRVPGPWKDWLLRTFADAEYHKKALSHEPPEWGIEACFQGLVDRGYAPRAVLDVGASTGGWSIFAMQYWPKATYFLLEANEERRPELEKLKRTASNVNYLIAGAADIDGQLPLGVRADDLNANSFAYPRQESRMVEVVRIDRLLREGRFAPPQFLKIDVQGFERNVLEGAHATIQHCDFVLLELNLIHFAPGMMLLHEGTHWMNEHGMVAYEIVDALRRPLDGAMAQCDVLFVRWDHPIRQSYKWSAPPAG